MFGVRLEQNMTFIPIPPADFNSAVTGSNWISMANHPKAAVVMMAGETAGNTFTVTLDQATDNAGTGTKTLALSNAASTGQRFLIGPVTGKYTVGEPITGDSSSNTAEVYQVGSGFILARCLTGGTTWTNGEALDGGTSGAAATLIGTGQDEDILLPFATDPSSTITVPAVTFKTYIINIDAASLDNANGFDHFQVDLSNPGGSVIGAGLIILYGARDRGVPMPSALGTKKIAVTTT